MRHLITATLARLTRRDIFTERTGPEWGFLDFDHLDHGGQDREVWGFGLHVVVSRLIP